MKTICPECAEQFEVSSDMVGKKAKCGECGYVFEVPKGDDKKKKKKLDNDNKEASQTAWLSLYLAGLALLMLLYSGHQGGLMAGMLFTLAIETAALYLVWQGFMLAWSLRTEVQTELVRMAILVNSILIGLFVLSLLLTIYALIAGPAGGGAGGLGGLTDVLKSLKDANKLIPN